jgi:predicted RNA-binding protein with PUA-like domain
MVLSFDEWEELQQLKEQELAVWEQIRLSVNRVTTSTYDAVYNPQKKET